MSDQEATTVVRNAFGSEVLDLDAGRLIGSACPGCGAHYFPQRRTCGRCLSEGLERVELSTSGTVYTVTVVHQSTPEFEVPYLLAYVDLPEGVRVPAQLSGCEPEEATIGMSVELVVEPFGVSDDGEPPLGYRFRPA